MSRTVLGCFHKRFEVKNKRFFQVLFIIRLDYEAKTRDEETIATELYTRRFPEDIFASILLQRNKQQKLFS